MTRITGPEASAQPAIAIRDVTLNYFSPDRETQALSNVSLEIAQGEFVAIVGSSGCGKSTLLSLISGLIRPSRGSIQICGKDVNGPSPRAGYMFQKDTLLEWRTVLDNVLLGPELLGHEREAARRRAEDLLHRYGLWVFNRSQPRERWGGMRQRAALARTLCPDPDLLLLDEPFSALDYQTRLALSDEIAAILTDERKTVVLVTHDIGEAISMADRVVVMSRRPGRIKSIHSIAYPSFGPDRPTPFQARKCAEFGAYFQLIWDELDVHQVQ
jgi:NitT/TauT family transport system ATP-binding protein